MNLLYELGRAGIAWSVTNSTSQTARGTTFNCVQATVVLEDGATFSGKFTLTNEYTPDQMLAGLLRKYAPRHPVTLRWLADQGGAHPVRLVAGALEDLGACIHTALRKQVFSKQSVIVWNAIHHLHPQDWSALQAALREAIAKSLAAKPRTRAQVGMLVRKATLRTLDELHSAPARDEKGRDARRTELETFALRSMLSACELTERDEWVWGWTAYLLKDADEPLGAEEQDVCDTPAPTAAA